MSFTSVKELLELSEKSGKQIWELAFEDDYNERNVSMKNSWNKMTAMWVAMKASSDNYDGNIKSHSGLSGGNGLKMKNYVDQCLSGNFIGQVMAEAISVAESNACMKCIVAAPTAGSCGVYLLCLYHLLKNITQMKILLLRLFIQVPHLVK